MPPKAKRNFEIDVDCVLVAETAVDVAAVMTAPEQRAAPMAASDAPGEPSRPAESKEGVEEWGVRSIDAPIFMMAAQTVCEYYKTSVNLSAPKNSQGLTQNEAMARMVSRTSKCTLMSTARQPIPLNIF